MVQSRKGNILLEKLNLKKLNKDSRELFGRLLIISIMIMMIAVYILVVFNKIFSKLRYPGDWVLYLILALLSASLVILLRPFISGMRNSIREWREKHLAEKKERGAKKEAKEAERKKKEAEQNEREAEKERIQIKKEEAERKEKKEAEKTKIESAPATGRAKSWRDYIPVLRKKKAEKKEEKLKDEKLSKEKWQNKKEKIPLVKELPKSWKIEIGRYETDIDALYKIIEKNGRIKLSAIAEYFGIDKRKAEEWAAILQEHNLAEIHYPPLSGPELRKVQAGINENKKEE